MTTTLRPISPLNEAADGARSRTYEVCDNGRSVGTLEVGTDPRFGPASGQLRHLEIAEGDRRRGRGTVAVLAAEEVLRGWGCNRITTTVPAEAPTGLALATAVGYTPGGHNMVKELAEPPDLPTGSSARPLTEAEYPQWLAAERAGYIESWLERNVTREQAESKADADYAKLLPNGPATPGTVLRVLTHDGVARGNIWVSVSKDHGYADGAYVFAVLVDSEHRGQGHGRTLLQIAERETLAAGRDRLGLHVFANNTPAIRLYESLGYRYTHTHLTKSLL
ncbi:GNAT family N-acetyltransferase [Streptomyces sp. HSW2009]|uniref:GNAT family N-acetyltransferase n=1 Tax=Streptomyces sp. HSW2009 TaxID=3142890 RepID=UPI0032ED9240